MIKLTHKENCCGCGACAAACPHGAIRMKADEMGFPYPEVDASACVDCGLCEQVCAFHPVAEASEPEAEAIRFPSLLDGSQSGGLATALMRKAIREGYVVYGAAIDSDFVVRHRRVTTLEGLEPLRLSKYVQSDMAGIPEQVLKDLESGQKVLFTGTPCQCAGIGSLCGNYRERLLLADIVCHGVPAPYVWRDYLALQEQRTGKKLVSAIFRDPSLGWKINLKERLTFEGGEQWVSDTYMWLLLKNMILRPSCLACPFTSVHRASDLSMADCWGVEKVLPGFADDNRGCSLLLVSTPAGASAVKSFDEETVRKTVRLADVMQETLQVPARPHRNAERFRRVYLKDGLARALGKYGRYSLRGWIQWILPRLNPFNTKLYRRLKKAICE